MKLNRSFHLHMGRAFLEADCPERAVKHFVLARIAFLRRTVRA